ncbi:MAG: hypothetical protein HS132_10030 [Planctomycetia bacterium]|nr:hypothetical protein [Planctomycetia bacterium]
MKEIPNKVYEKKHGYEWPNYHEDKRGICTKQGILCIKGKEDKANNRQGDKEDAYYAKNNGMVVK